MVVERRMYMELHFDPRNRVTSTQTETYLAFRSAVSKPSNEDAHLRHILRFYMARAMQKRGEQNVYILPQVEVEGKTLRMDVAAGSPGKYTLCICEPGSVTSETEELLEALKNVEGIH